jgi:hypothetical protein
LATHNICGYPHEDKKSLSARGQLHRYYGLPRYISMLAFKTIILDIIEDELDQSDPNPRLFNAKVSLLVYEGVFLA